MKKKPAVLIALLCSFLLSPAFSWAAHHGQEPERVEAQKQEQIYGSQMMTEQERNEYRARMQAAKTNEEREQIRMQHHERMQERAQSQGLSMPETPPPRGGGMGGGKGRSK